MAVLDARTPCHSFLLKTIGALLRTTARSLDPLRYLFQCGREGRLRILAGWNSMVDALLFAFLLVAPAADHPSIHALPARLREPWAKPRVRPPPLRPIESHLEPWDCLTGALLESIEQINGAFRIGLYFQGQWLRVTARVLKGHQDLEPGDTISLLALEAGVVSLRKA